MSFVKQTVQLAAMRSVALCTECDWRHEGHIDVSKPLPEVTPALKHTTFTGHKVVERVGTETTIIHEVRALIDTDDNDLATMGFLAGTRGSPPLVPVIGELRSGDYLKKKNMENNEPND